jgi:hypothetical protein
VCESVPHFDPVEMALSPCAKGISRKKKGHDWTRLISPRFSNLDVVPVA